MKAHKDLTLRTIAVAIVLGTVARTADAQLCDATGANATCSVNATTSITIPAILRLTIAAGSTPFGSVTVTDYDNGYAQLAGPVITAKANQSWQVQVSSTATFWTAVTTDPGNPARATKPLADLQWSASAGGPFVAVSGTGASAGSGTGTGGTVVPIFLRSLWAYSLDTPGNYSVAVTFTFVSP